MDRPRVLLIWPGAIYGGGGNFGVPQLLSITGAIERNTTARVALARHLGADVRGLELVPELCAWAERVLPGAVEQANAHETARWSGARKVHVGFSVDHVPEEWLRALAPGGRLLAPVGSTLTLFLKNEDGTLEARPLARVRYVRDRAAMSAESNPA